MKIFVYAKLVVVMGLKIKEFGGILVYSEEPVL
jgi:hypothetical protein